MKQTANLITPQTHVEALTSLMTEIQLLNYIASLSYDVSQLRIFQLTSVFKISKKLLLSNLKRGSIQCVEDILTKLNTLPARHYENLSETSNFIGFIRFISELISFHQAMSKLKISLNSTGNRELIPVMDTLDSIIDWRTTHIMVTIQNVINSILIKSISFLNTFDDLTYSDFNRILLLLTISGRPLIEPVYFYDVMVTLCSNYENINNFMQMASFREHLYNALPTIVENITRSGKLLACVEVTDLKLNLHRYFETRYDLENRIKLLDKIIDPSTVPSLKGIDFSRPLEHQPLILSL